MVDLNGQLWLMIMDGFAKLTLSLVLSSFNDIVRPNIVESSAYFFAGLGLADL